MEASNQELFFNSVHNVTCVTNPGCTKLKCQFADVPNTCILILCSLYLNAVQNCKAMK
jgi:hypothetical protein